MDQAITVSVPAGSKITITVEAPEMRGIPIVSAMHSGDEFTYRYGGAGSTGGAASSLTPKDDDEPAPALATSDGRPW